MRRGGWIALLLVWLAGLGPAAAAPLEALSALAAEGQAVSALVVDLGEGRVLADLAPDRDLIPASTTKLVTAARALAVWGPEKRFETAVRTLGERQGERLEGDLVLVGGGDPALTGEGLWRLARDVAAQGLRAVSGDLVVDASHFGALACVTEDRCEARRFSRHSYDAPLSAAGVDYSNVALAVTPAAKAGAGAALSLDPYPLPNIAIEGRVETEAGAGVSIAVDRLSEPGRQVLRVSGRIGQAHGPARIYRSVAEPERHAGELFRRLLAGEGVSVMGAVRVSFAPAGGESLVARVGSGLQATLGDMMRYSNNYIADLLALGLLKEETPAAAADLPAAGNRLEDYLRALAGHSRFGGASGARLADGSGLNPINRLSARDLVVLLDQAYRQPAVFPGFLGTLQVPQHSRSRFLGGGDEPWFTHFAFKSGGLSEPVTVASLAGYIRFADDGWGAFAVVVNGAAGAPPLGRGQALDAIRHDLAAVWSAR